MNTANFYRWVRDAALMVVKALPAANAANFSDPIDFGAELTSLVDDIDILVEVPATPNLADAHAITLTLKDSPDNVTFTAISGLAALTITGAGGVGAAAFSQRVKLPPGTNQYLRLDAAVANGGGDNTAISATLSVLVTS